MLPGARYSTPYDSMKESDGRPAGIWSYNLGPVLLVAMLVMLAYWVIELPTGQESLVLAIRGNDTNGIRRLVAAGVSVNARLLRQRTPLMVAAEAGQVDAVRTLLTLGADRALRDDDGRTAYDYARMRAHTNAASLLGGAVSSQGPP